MSIFSFDIVIHHALMDNIEIPDYFICPISLQIMKDPVTTLPGITYDRESIEQWLFNSNNRTICPVTMQPLPADTDLTPNHTLRRLIQAWCTVNATHGVDPIPTPQPPLNKCHAVKLISDLRHPDLQTKIKALQKMEALAAESDRNRVLLQDADLTNALISFIVSCYEKRSTKGLEEALSLFNLVQATLAQLRGTVTVSENIVESLIWVLGAECFRDNVVVKPHAACLMKVVIQRANASALERLKPEFFGTLFSNLRPDSFISQQGMLSLLHILLETCPWGRNRVIMIESGGVFDLIEVMELRNLEKKTTELVLEILCHLCSCADGRAQLVNHAAGIHVVSRRILKVSPMADDSAVFIIWLISKYSGTSAVLNEMLRVGTVAKLCMVMQANCAAHLKEKVKEILRSHSDVWKQCWTGKQVDGYRKTF
ncbi:hypothetical protein OROGR_017762 [Orobanche gracilis]